MEQEYVNISSPSDGENSGNSQNRGGLDKSANKNAGGFGIFDKIYNYLNRQNKQEEVV